MDINEDHMTVEKISRRDFLRKSIFGVSGARLFSRFPTRGAKVSQKPNILFLTADDMHFASPGVYGCKIPNITPNIDRLAREGVRFTNAHIPIAVCGPCRSSLMTGRYPHRNGAEGFEPIDTHITTLQEKLDEAGYINGILGKTDDLKPYHKFKWSMLRHSYTRECSFGRDPDLYYQWAKEFLKLAKKEGKPFFLMANPRDPHRPFAGSQQERDEWGMNFPFRRKIRPKEVEVPGFLPDIPDVRLEISEYYSSVHRCDETVGKVLQALRESGLEENTLVMFLSDNGIAFPFAKTNCYLNSTKTPWIVRWPGFLKPGTVDSEHLISGIDFMPTILDAVGLPMVGGMDGQSFIPVLKGQKQPWRNHVFTVFHETYDKIRYEMRCIQNKKFGYIFNPWSDGKKVFKNYSQEGLTFKAMKRAGKTDPEIAARVKLFLYRVPEELYDFENDPNAVHNLIDNPLYSAVKDELRKGLLEWMKGTDDHLLDVFKKYLEGIPFHT